mmetsp:Transcript_85513/g.275883  ORF Transcript_85513/g.275883 Transcript_85513/m.275883 type:complete len:732 (-) Transcript_85513:91-2286(-)
MRDSAEASVSSDMEDEVRLDMQIGSDDAAATSSERQKSLSKVGQDHIAGPGPDENDPAAAVASRRVRFLVFVLLCQVVQAFMSYDGGATPASIDTIQKDMHNSWTAGEFGMLGAMDKIGMTVTSLFWGRLLQSCNTKALLVFGLAVNTLWTAIFGLLQAKGPMYVAKFAMGATQSLQGVWATVWTVTMAPPSSKTTWLGLGGVSAGLGNGLGTAVAGFATAAGAPYALAFEVQAAVLGLLLLFLVFCPQRWLQMHIPDASTTQGSTAATPFKEASATGAGDDLDTDTVVDVEDIEAPVATKALSAASADCAPTTTAGSSNSTLGDDLVTGSTSASASGSTSSKEQRRLRTREQILACWRNKVFLWSALALSNTMFVLSGIQFLWVRVFVEVWGLDKSHVTLAFLLISGIGGGVGIALGPRHIDKLGGFGNATGVVRSLRELRKFSLIAVLGGFVGIVCLYAKLKDTDYRSSMLDSNDRWPWLLFVALTLIWGAHNASVAGLCGINMEVVQPRMRTFASGAEMTSRNILGYTCGPLIPGLVMDSVATLLKWDLAGSKEDRDWQLCLGLGFVLAFNFSLVWVLNKAVALQKLQAALQTESIELLEEAVNEARGLDMHTTRDGEAVIGMANEAVGSFHSSGRAWAEGARAFTASREDLKISMVTLEHRVDELDQKNQVLQKENARLCLRLAEAESVASRQASLLAPPAEAKMAAGADAEWSLAAQTERAPVLSL